MGYDFEAIEMKRLLPVSLAACPGHVRAVNPSQLQGKTCNCGGMGAYRQEVIDGRLMNGNSLSCGNIIACNALSIQLINFLSE